MYCVNFLDNSGAVAPWKLFLNEEVIPPLPKNLDLVEDGGGAGDCNCAAVGAFWDLKEYVLCIFVRIDYKKLLLYKIFARRQGVGTTGIYTSTQSASEVGIGTPPCIQTRMRWSCRNLIAVEMWESSFFWQDWEFLAMFWFVLIKTLFGSNIWELGIKNSSGS